MTIIDKILIILTLLLMVTIVTYGITQSQIVQPEVQPELVQPELTIDNVIDNLDRSNIANVEYGKSAKFNDMRMISITFKNRVSADSAEDNINKQIYQSYKYNNYFNLNNEGYAYLYSNNKGQDLFLMRNGNKIMVIIGNNFGAELTKYIQTFSR